MIKLVAIDLDGTLLNKDMEISNTNKEALNALIKNNIKIVIATGRPDLFVKQFVEELNLDTPYILFNGGLVKNFQTNEILVRTLLDKKIILKTLHLLEENNTAYMLYGESEVFYKECNRVDYLMKMSQKVDEKHRAKFTYIKDYHQIVEHNEFNKVLVIEEDKEKYEIIYQKLQNIKTDFDIVRSTSFYIEIIPKGVSKKEGIKAVSEYYNISKDEIMALGDQENDLEMIKYVTYGIAMGNAIDKIKEQAYDVTLENTENGVAYAINKHILSKL